MIISPSTNNTGSSSSSTITCNGVYIEMAACLWAVTVKIGDIVKRKGGTMEEATEGAFFIILTDRAVHPRLQVGD